MKTNYPGLLVVANVLLLIASTVLMYLGASLLAFYQLDKMDFVSPWFRVVPHMVLALGVASFVVAIVGVAVTASASSSALDGSGRWPLMGYALLMVALLVTHLAGIFAAMELRSVITRREYNGHVEVERMEHYLTDTRVKNKWDSLQKEFHCCGVINYNDGYQIWRTTDIGRQHSVPDSCCLVKTPDCGRNIFLDQEQTIQRKINMHGCLSVLEDKLNDQVVPILLGYAAIGTLLGLVQLLCIVFAFAFAAAISRAVKTRTELDESQSLRCSTPISMPAETPTSLGYGSKARSIDDGDNYGYGRDNLSSAFVYEYKMGSKMTPTPSQLGEREV